MVRKCRARRSAMAIGVKKSKVRAAFKGKNLFERIEEQLPRKCVAFLYKLSEHCFILFTKTCCNFHLIPISLDCDNRAIARKTKFGLAAHCSVLIFQMVRMLHILLVTISLGLEGPMDLRMVLSILSLLTYFLCFSVPASVLLRPCETAQILNTIPILLSLNPKEDGRVTSMFQNAKNTIFILVLTFIAGSGALLASAFGFLVHTFPLSFYHVVESATGRPDCIPPLLWKLMFWPMEYMTFLQATTLTSFATMILVTFPNIGMLCTNEMR